MTTYKIFWKKSAKKELKKIEKKYIKNILENIKNLSKEPHPKQSKKLIGTENIYRIRIGNYRVVYSVEDQELIIEIIRVRHRKDIYR